MPTRNSVGDYSLRDTCSHCTFDNGRNRVHGSDNLGLILGWHMEFDLLEKVFRSAKTANNKDILK
jgi:hypothetical protein